MEKFRDLARNERNYLAWLRTSFVILLFGFLIRETELILQLIAANEKIKLNPISATAIDVIGMIMMIAALFLIIVSTVRFVIQKITILKAEETKKGIIILSQILALIVIICVLFLIAYFFVALVPPMTL